MRLLALAVAFLGGVLLSQVFRPVWEATALLLIASFLLATLLGLSKKSLVPALLLAAMCAGLLRVHFSDLDRPDSLAGLHQEQVSVEGIITTDPESAGQAWRFRFRAESVDIEGQTSEVAEVVLVTAMGPAQVVSERGRHPFRYGDRRRLTGILEATQAEGGYDYAAYLARQGIHSRMLFPEVALVEAGQGARFYQWLYSLRRSLADSISEVVAEPQASVGQAMLVGLREGIPDELNASFQRSGLTHILAISGMNIGIVLGLSIAISRGLFGRRNLYLLLPLAVLWLYALMAGMSPSVARAAVMGTVYLAALFFGRPNSALPGLGLAAGVMVAITPAVLWDISFQLSFAAVAGIAAFTQPITGLLRSLPALRGGLGAAVAEPIAVTVAATATTIPLTAFYFQSIAWVGVPATLLVLPVLPFILVAHALAGLVGLASATVGGWFGWVAWLPTAYVTEVTDLAARVPGGQLETGQLAVLFVFLYYGILVAFLLWGPLKRLLDRLGGSSATERPVEWGVGPKLALPTVAAVAVTALIWIAAATVPDGKLHVVFIDVGQGDAIFIETPSGQQVLVDGGPDPLEAVQFLGARMGFADRSLGLVVLTHPHADHAVGLAEVLKRYQVRWILETGEEHMGPAYAAWRLAVGEEDAAIVHAQEGQIWSIGDGVSIQVLNPPAKPLRGTSSDVNNSSVVLRIAYGQRSFLLTGDIFEEGEDWMVRQGASLDSDVLKVAHHGSRTSSSEDFLNKVTPRFAVVSVGRENRFGHPHPDTLEMLREKTGEGAVLTTAEHGTIEMMTDGERLEVKTER
jgi:competence protein ComEC